MRQEIDDREAVQRIEPKGVRFELRSVLPDLWTAEGPTPYGVGVGLWGRFVEETDYAIRAQFWKFFLVVPRHPLDVDSHVGKVWHSSAPSCA